MFQNKREVPRSHDNTGSSWLCNVSLSVWLPPVSVALSLSLGHLSVQLQPVLARWETIMLLQAMSKL